MKFISLNLDHTKDMIMSLADGGGDDPTSRTSEFDFTITSTLTQPLYLTQSAANAITVDWGDGSEPDNPSDLAASLSHEYAEAGDYTVKVTVADGETCALGLTSGSDHYGIIGKYTTKSDTYPTLTGARLNGGMSLGVYSFTQCTGLTSFTIPTGESRIPQCAFYQCTGLTSFTIPDSINAIGSDAFYGCTGLTAVYISDLSAWCRIVFYSRTSNPLNLAHTLYCNGTLVTSLEIPSGVTGIGSYVFTDCTSITSVTIGNSLTIIGAGAFYGCTGLTSVTIGNSLTSIGTNAFYGCSGLTSITIPDSVSSIGGSAFTGCNGLTAVYISDLSAWCSIAFADGNSNPLNLAHTLYLNGTLVTSLEIPSGVTSIGSYAFTGCIIITSVTIGNSVTSIGNYAFSGCTGITSVTIGNSVTSIGNAAFSSCTSITSITSENTTPPTIQAGTFINVPADCQIYVPAASVDAYKAASNWSARADYIQAIPA